MARVDVLTTDAAGQELLADLRVLVGGAFADEPDGFGDTDWANALGGHHVVVTDGGVLVAHAAVVPRTLHVAGRPVATGYVEAVATAPDRRRQGHGTAAVRAATALVQERYALGALSTGLHGFYGRLGWRRWSGRTWVRRDGALVRTPDDDDALMVLLVGGAALDLTADVACEDRPGDPW